MSIWRQNYTMFLAAPLKTGTQVCRFKPNIAHLLFDMGWVPPKTRHSRNAFGTTWYYLVSTSHRANWLNRKSTVQCLPRVPLVSSLTSSELSRSDLGGFHVQFFAQKEVRKVTSAEQGKCTVFRVRASKQCFAIHPPEGLKRDSQQWRWQREVQSKVQRQPLEVEALRFARYFLDTFVKTVLLLTQPNLSVKSVHWPRFQGVAFGVWQFIVEAKELCRHRWRHWWCFTFYTRNNFVTVGGGSTSQPILQPPTHEGHTNSCVDRVQIRA